MSIWSRLFDRVDWRARAQVAEAELDRIARQRLKALGKAHAVLRRQREEQHETRVNLFAQLRRETGLQ